MIRTDTQARAAQQSRIASGKRGHAKAVRRYAMRVHGEQYREWLKELPVRWELPWRRPG